MAKRLSRTPHRVRDKKKRDPVTPQTGERIDPKHPESEESLAPADDDAGGDLAFSVVGVGASAGGLEAFNRLLQHLPPDSGMAFVFVQHLDPKHATLLAELLGRETTMPVTEAVDGVAIAPNHVYVIPRNTHMTITRGRLVLKPRAGHGPFMAIDHFFRSLAEDAKSRAIGIVLSGTASDGALGLKAIKAAGGVTFAQDPETAKYSGMPQSAIAAGCVDFVMPAEVIAKELTRFAGYSPPPVTESSTTLDLSRDSDSTLHRILTLLRTTTGIDFTYYKATTIKRRISRRMMLYRMEKTEKYFEMLRSNPTEVQALYEDILISVTQFFRDPEAFETLKKSVFPDLMATKAPQAPVRIWVPGCSTGEEAYSIAIALLEFLEENSDHRGVQLFATDISDTALEKARTGVYPDTIAQDVSPERLKHFFIRLESGYQIAKRIREMCVFARQNLAKDPPFSKLDLISCRNVLIYLGPVLQKRIVPVFHYALNPDGYLMLGTSETIGSSADLFTLLDKKHKIFTPKPAPNGPAFEFAMADRTPAQPNLRQKTEDWSDIELQREADRIVLSKYGPAGVVVDDDMNILQFRGRTTPFLEPAAGAASLKLFKMTREGLMAELRNALNEAKRTNASVRREGLRLRHDRSHVLFHLEVIPFTAPTGDRRFLITFEQPLPAESPSSGTAPQAEARRGKKMPKLIALEKENAQLLQDLAATREYLQSIIEEQEAANEELRSANEEIQSSNEELQSTNEELETAREELQSTNEELNTVNEELQNRNSQIGQTSNDLMNLLSNVSIPIVMMGNDLRIRRFTPISEKLLNLIPTDIGRPVSDIKFNIDIPNLREVLLEVVENLNAQTLEVRDWEGRRYSLRVRPYRTEDNKIDGVVMVLIDVDRSAPEELVDAAQSAIAPEALRIFARRLIAAQEEERRRVSRELHDDLNQKLALLEVNVDILNQCVPSTDSRVRDSISLFRTYVGELSEGLRRIAYNLHPSLLEDLGLVAALQSYVADVTRRDGFEIRFRHQDVPADISRETAITVFRIVQEAVRNSIKHSGAKSISVTLLGLGSTIRASIRESGLGFNFSERRGKGLGIISMEERARLVGGALTIKTSPGSGTVVDVEVPLEEQATEATGS